MNFRDPEIKEKINKEVTELLDRYGFKTAIVMATNGGLTVEEHNRLSREEHKIYHETGEVPGKHIDKVELGLVKGDSKELMIMLALLMESAPDLRLIIEDAIDALKTYDSYKKVKAHVYEES